MYSMFQGHFNPNSVFVIICAKSSLFTQIDSGVNYVMLPKIKFVHAI
jgi:hypothetical protein